MSARASYRYAKALLDLATEKKREDAVLNDTELILSSLARSEDLSSLLTSPAYKPEKKKEILLSVFENRIDPLTQKLFGLLSDNNRIELLEPVLQSYTDLYNHTKGIVEAQVITAVPVNGELKEKILQKARAVSKGKKITLSNIIDPDIIGGYILRVGDIQIDAGISGRLKTLKRALTQ